jgi:DNA polymerase (family X)
MNGFPTKTEIAELLEEIADLLDLQDANVFRVRSYRQGARSIRQTDADVAAMGQREDMDGLKALPDIGEGLARVIIEYATSGRSSLLDELQGQATPEALFAQVPGIGEELARRIVAELKVSSLEELEQAAYDGRLDQVEGFGEKRLEMVRASLASRLTGATQRRRSSPDEPVEAPPVSLLLAIDADYRQRAEQGDLPTIAPKRFNPDQEKWLPILNTTRQGWKFTVLFSNTAQAHELGKTRDWVVIYFEPAGGGTERQHTVVTAQSGSLAGRRVVRGREKETREFYRQRE